jgi:hypothetical protein
MRDHSSDQGSETLSDSSAGRLVACNNYRDELQLARMLAVQLRLALRVVTVLCVGWLAKRYESP